MWTGRPLFQWGALTQTHPSKHMLEIEVSRNYGDLHMLQTLRYGKSITEHALLQDVHTIQAITFSLDTVVDPDCENTKSIPGTSVIQR